jgi:hypothetical protein
MNAECHWAEYAIDGALLALSMISAWACAVVLEHRTRRCER